jgi:uncharacterized protein
MFTFARQIRQATDFARNAPGRLAGVTPPDFAATDDTTLAAARNRVEKSLAFVESITPAQIEGTEDQDISWMAGGTQRTMTGRPLPGTPWLAEPLLPHYDGVQHSSASRH